ncbi:diguanylate cyclase domain-containing protein [Thiohalorhabdus sp. Cl-TMA]|uniref:Diguanylate cyclase domain-containing protein n=1 Tax=Thiohalorhabdus methylotrophus TaxID=3242694 RepID=A0ABV4TXR7_9GAMM
MTWIDVTTLKERERALELQWRESEYYAYRDGLTGLPNRQLVEDRLSRSCTQARRQEGVVAVMFLDLDGFKPINDTYGHATGDRVLQAVAERLLHSFREEDTVGRMGGDEFVGIFELDTKRSRTAAIRIATVLLETVLREIPVQGRRVSLSGSVGIALCPWDGVGVEKVLECADRALYRAKAQGGNTYMFWDGTATELLGDPY